MTLTIAEARKYVLVAAATLLVLDLICIGLLLSPLAKSRGELQGRLDQLRSQLRSQQQELGPSRGMDKKLQSASATTAGFYNERLPELYSEIDGALTAAEKESGVHVSAVHYATGKQTGREQQEIQIPEGLRQVNIKLRISGQYVQDVKFINALERSKVFFVIQGVNLLGERANEQQRSSGREPNVELQLDVETYLRRGAA